MKRDLANFIIGLEEQRRCLDKLLLEYKRNTRGGSCLLYGRRYSGKSLLLEEILDRHFSDEDGIVIQQIDGNKYTSSTPTSKIFSDHGLSALVEIEREHGEDKEKATINMPKILFIIDHFENFTKRSNQNFLYRILNGSQMYPWFVILIGTTENCVSNLEKRIRSRLSKLKINCNEQFSFEQFEDGFFQFLNKTSLSKQAINELENDPKMRDMLNCIYKRHNSMAWLKKCVQLFELVYQKEKNLGSRLNAIRLFQYCAEALFAEDKQRHVMDDLSVRHLCLLNCLARLEKSNLKIHFGYRQIAQEYYRFTNDYCKIMRVRDLVLFKDLDELVAMKLLILMKRTTLEQVQFRKATLNVETEAIKECLNRRKHMIPTNILPWFNCY